MKKNLERSINDRELFFVEFTMFSFKKYFNVIEDSIQDYHIDILERNREFLNEIESKNYKGDDLNFLLDSAYYDVKEVERGFFQRFRYSMIIQIYSFLETELINYCNSHHAENQKEYKFKDLRGESDLEKIKKYLLNSADKNLMENPLWEFINNLRKLRNCIAHSNGLLDIKSNDFSSIKKFSKDNFKLEDCNDGESYLVIISYSQFIRRCIDNVETFLLSVIK